MGVRALGALFLVLICWNVCAADFVDEMQASDANWIHDTVRDILKGMTRSLGPEELGTAESLLSFLAEGPPPTGHSSGRSRASSSFLLSTLRNSLGPGVSADAGGTGSDSWKDLFVLDCTGTLRIASSFSDLTINMSSLKTLWALIAEELRSRALCACSDLSDEELLRRFVPSVNMLVAALTGVNDSPTSPTTVTDSCPGKFVRGFFVDTVLGQLFASGQVRWELPDTCTYEGVLAGSPCNFKVVDSITNTQLMYSMQTCGDNSPMPYVSVSCQGWYCRNLYKPCTVDSDCGSAGECSLALNQTQIEDMLVHSGVIDNVSQLSSCDLGSWVQTGMQYINSLFGTPSSALPTEIRVCYPSEATIDKIKHSLEFEETRSLIDTPEMRACLATGCKDVLSVGDGTCDQACNNAACKWDGGDCNAPAHLHCPSSNDFECSGHGSCNSLSDDDDGGDDDANFQCQCFPGFSGSGCSGRDNCFANPSDEYACSGFGYCNTQTNGGTCQCFAGHTGQHCEQASATCPTNSQTGEVCSGHGVCRGQELGTAYCECFDGWQGEPEPCSGGGGVPDPSICPGYLSQFNVPCNGHGTGLLSNNECTCSCAYEYGGPNCTYQLSLHQCIPATQNGQIPPPNDDGYGYDDDDNTQFITCGAAGTCLPPVAGFPSKCLCDANAQPPACNIMTQPGVTQTERPCVQFDVPCNVSATVFSGNFEAWNGQLPNGETANSADRQSGFAFAADAPPLTLSSVGGATTSFYRACDGSSGISFGLPGLGIAVKPGNLQAWTMEWTSLLNKLQKCRAQSMNETPLTATQFLARFVPSSTLWLLYPFTAGSGGPENFNAGFEGSDWAASDPWRQSWKKEPRVQAPDSCSFETVASSATGNCQMEFSGFGSLLGAEVKVAYQAEQCEDMNSESTSWGLPSQGFIAEGPASTAMSSMQPCTVDADCTSLGAGLACRDLSAAGYLNLGKYKGVRRDPIGMALFGLNDFNEQCSTTATFHHGIRSVLLSMTNQAPDDSSSLKFCMYPNGVTQESLELWAIGLGNLNCIVNNDASCLTDPIVITELASSTYQAAPPKNLNTDVLYHGPTTPPPGLAWVGVTVQLPGLTQADLTLGKANKFKQALLADVEAHASISGLGPEDVLIMQVAESGSGRRLLGSGPSVQVGANIQVPSSSEESVKQVVTGSGSSSFGGELGQTLAKYGVISKADSGKVDVKPGLQGLSPGHDVAGIVIGVLAAVTVVAAIAVVVIRRRRRRAQFVPTLPKRISTAPSLGRLLPKRKPQADERAPLLISTEPTVNG